MRGKDINSEHKSAHNVYFVYTLQNVVRNLRPTQEQLHKLFNET